VKLNSEKISNDFLELASEQRLNIMINLAEKKLSISKLATLLDATRPEVHRNVHRLARTGLIAKDLDGNFKLTTFGESILIQIQSISFISNNKKFFTTHTLGNLPPKFIQRLGALQEKKHVKGFVKVIEKWTKIHQNAKNHIYNILFEVPYSGDIIDIISSQLKNNVHIRSIFSESTVISEDRKKIFEEKGFKKHVISGILERKMKHDMNVGVFVTDKDGAIIFPNLEGVPDLSEMFISSDSDFRDWCYDYFEWCWKNSTSFQESKLKE